MKPRRFAGQSPKFPLCWAPKRHRGAGLSRTVHRGSLDREGRSPEGGREAGFSCAARVSWGWRVSASHRNFPSCRGPGFLCQGHQLRRAGFAHWCRGCGKQVFPHFGIFPSLSKKLASPKFPLPGAPGAGVPRWGHRERDFPATPGRRVVPRQSYRSGPISESSLAFERSCGSRVPSQRRTTKPRRGAGEWDSDQKFPPAHRVYCGAEFSPARPREAGFSPAGVKCRGLRVTPFYVVPHGWQGF